MPNYVYECSECEEIIEVFHSMSYEKKDCDLCGAENTLRKIPEVPIYVKTNNSGKVVKKHIEDTKNQIREDKKNMTKDYEG
tara:strand:+ start:1921 stop:2163 length:243 start_codon:yes stop_codon:yes gene_type:complete